MRRREFITALGGAAASWPLAAQAQPSDKIYRVGYLALLPGEEMTLAKSFRLPLSSPEEAPLNP